MFKKKLSILLLLLLAVLFIGSYSTTYADSQRIWNKSMIQNFIYNYIRYYSNGNFTETQIQNYITQLDSKIDNIVDEFNTNYHVLCWAEGGTNGRIYLASTNANTTVYLASNTFHSTNTVWKTHQISWWANDDYVTTGYLSCPNAHNTNYLIADETVYSSSDLFTATVIYARGTIKPNANILTSPYTNDFFDYSYNSSLDNLTVPKVNETIKSMTYSQFITEYVAEVGMIKFLDYISVGQFYWDNSINDWKLLRSSNNYIVNNDTTSDNLLEVYCPQNWWYGNTLLAFEALSRPGAEYGGVYNFWVYLTDNNTIINNGALNVGSFSGDYDNNIQNDIQHDQTIDAINNINDTITSFNSGDASNFVNFGDMPQIDDPTSNLLSYLLSRISYAFTEDFSSSYIDIPFLSTTTRVYADDFDFLPTQLTTIIAAIAIIGLVKRYFPKIHALITAVSTANIGSFAEKIQGGLSVVDIL